MEEALQAAAASPYALGASVFGPVAEARAFAERVNAGSVVVNDVIVPTADPRLPFGGRGESGFGATRGAAGLLEMTALKAVSVRRGPFRPHLAPPGPKDARRFAGMIRWLHGG
jgi:acyl-CoA reductase-like NAD-dependent aldehyde dehydrogenase